METRLMLLLVITCSSFAFQADTIRTDGVIGKDEWKSATEYDLGKGNKVLMRKENDVLYVALIGAQRIWAHVYLSDEKVVKVMHASAALDAVAYRKVNSLWLPSDEFQFEMRGRIYDTEMEGVMAKYFTANRWVANNNNFGDGKVIEVKINIAEWKSPLYLACVMANNDMSLHPLPTTLTDDTVLPHLVQGYTPDSLRFEPVHWKKIK